MYMYLYSTMQLYSAAVWLCTEQERSVYVDAEQTAQAIATLVLKKKTVTVFLFSYTKLPKFTFMITLCINDNMK